MGPRFERIPTRSENAGSSSGKVQCDGLARLEDVLVDTLPASVHLLILCRIARQNLFPPDVQVEFYRFTDSVEEGDNVEWWKRDEPPFILCIQRPNIHAKKGIILFPPPCPTDEMIQAFDHFLGWSEPQCFHCAPPSFWSALQSMCTAHNNAKPENNVGIPGIMFSILDVEQAKNIQVSAIGNGIHCLRPVEDKDVKEMVDQWKWRASHSEEILRKCIKTLTSCALFVGTELASWVVQSPLGGFNVLYTAESHRRKGYGKIVMEWISKTTATSQGIPPMAEVEIWNDASRQLLETVGYHEVFKTKWFYYDPPSI